VDLGSDISGGGLAVVMRAFEGGGAQRDMVLLCNALLAKGVRLTILVLRDEGPLRSLLDPGIRVIPVSGQRLRYALPGLRRAIRAIAPRLVVSSEAGLNLCSLVAVRSLPRADRPRLVLREVGSPSIAQHQDPCRQNRLAYRILRHFYRYADHIITLTEGARRDLAQNFSVPERMISVMRVNAVIPPAMAGRIAGWDGESGREPDLIVCVGRLSPEKDHRTLLQALTLLAPRRPWRLAIVGEGPQRAALESFARRHGLTQRVIFTGHVADPFAWMMRARVAVCASVYEGLCNAIIEALACGTPVVSTDCPYGPREILQDGRYGRLTPVGDAPAMASGIEAALDEVAERGFLTARGLNHTAENAAAKFLEIVAELHLRPTGVERPAAAASTT
jgi:glycosyltransferase involved in cell wall biosynthesis